MSKLSMLFVSIVAVASFSSASVAQQTATEAKESFDQRQMDLVNLAGHFGALHRIQQLCTYGADVDLYRNRMREIVPLEVPMERTRSDMIEAFNSTYRAFSSEHMVCGDEAKAAYQAQAAMALDITERLHTSFPTQIKESQ